MAGGVLGFVGRVLVAMAVALVAAGIVGDAVGAKTEATYTGAIPVAGGPKVAAVMVWALSTNGHVEARFEGAQAVYYVKVKGDPMGLVSNASRLGVRVENSQVNHDFRTGVLVAHATLSANPLLVAGIIREALQRGNAIQANGTVSVDLQTRESVIAIAVPAPGAQAVSYTLTFTVEGYRRAPDTVIALASTSMAAAGVALIAASRRRGST